MLRPLLTATLLLAGSTAAYLGGCDAHVTEGCLAGPCTALGSGGSSSVGAGMSATNGTGGASSTTGTGGTGGTADTCPPVAQSGDFPCDVFAVVHQRCNPCHQMPPSNGAPFPLLTYEDTQQVYVPGKLVFQQMYDQIQPGAQPRMPLGGQLTDAEMATLGGWLAMCAPPVPAGTGCGCPGTGCN